MIKMYSTDMQTNITEETKEFKKGNWINMVSPTEDEIKMVCSKLEIQEDFIRYSLDEEEKARIDIGEDSDVDVPNQQDKKVVKVRFIKEGETKYDNWGFLFLYIGLFLMTQPFSADLRIEALANWTTVFIGFLVYFVGVIFGIFGFLREQTPLRWINLAGLFIGIVLVSIFMFLPNS